MRKLIVGIKIFGKTKDEWDEKSANLSLETLAPVTPDGAKPKAFGRWTSPSPYLGKDYSGKYFVQNVRLADEERWMTDTVYEFNPYGFFFDSTSPTPFLVLNLFEPMSMDKPARSGGGGQLLQVSLAIRDSKLRWYVDSGKSVEELRKELLEKLGNK